MHEVPECLNRRYRAVDELVNELVSSMPNKSSEKDAIGLSRNDPSIKLMCEFWNILKENPDCDLPKAVYEQLCHNAASSYHFTDMPTTQELTLSSIMSPVTPCNSPPPSKCFQPQQFTCYMANESTDNENKESDSSSKCAENPKEKYQSESCSKCAENPKQKCYLNSKNSGGGWKSPSSSANTEDKLLPLSRVLCDLKEAASFDQQCNKRLNELLQTEADIQAQIEELEKREVEGTQMLKQADCMWACMEETYKRKVAESLARQKELLQHAQKIEKSTSKWRKSKKDLELQMVQLMKCQEEIKEKVNQKNNDMKVIDKEIIGFQKRIESNSKDAKDITCSLTQKKANSDARMAAIAKEKKTVEAALEAEKSRKCHKEIEGNNYIKEARVDLQKICRVLLQKRLENEDLLAEKDALIQEIEMLKVTCNHCQIKCKSKEDAIEEEIKSLDKEIKEYKARCIQCHECNDTSDVRKFCTDCPRCLQERDCVYNIGDCSPDKAMDCVCQCVKQKFLDNVFENMYTVLENETRTGHGQEVAAVVLDCLKRSRNGKLDTPTKQVLQEFILTTVKKNLNLTIVGGAVKTRCEMDASTYEQLMACLKIVQTTKPAKEDKGTLPRKEPCKRWGGSIECNCPKGPNACICTKKAPPRSGKGEAGPCPDNQEEDDGEAEICPHKDNPCGTSCGVRGFSNKVGADVSAWRPDPCKRTSCHFKKNMRAAQCVLGPELLHENAFAQKLQLPDTFKAKKKRITENEVLPFKPIKQGEKQLKAGIVDESLKGQIPQKKVNTNKKVSNMQVQVSSAKSHIKSEVKSSQYNVKKSTECCTSLISTSSGKLAMELDEKIIEKIERKTRGSSTTFVTLRETGSGNFLIDFNAKQIYSDDSQKVLLKRSMSGKFSFEIDKRLINSLISDVNLNKLNTSSSVSIGLVKKSRHKNDGYEKINKSRNKNRILANDTIKLNNLDDKQQKKSVVGLHISNSNIETSSLTSASKILDVMKMYRQASLTQYLFELDDAYQKGKDEIDLKIHSENESVTHAKAKLIKSTSGNFSLNIKDFAKHTSILENVMEYVSSITRSESGSYELYLETKKLSKPPNTIVRKTTSGEYSVIFTKPVLRTLASELKIPTAASTQKIYKLNARANNNIIEVPALLKLTSSGNYILVLDKEFELENKHKLKKCFENDTTCYAQLTYTSSNTVCINFAECSHQVLTAQNALLLRSASGNIKVYVNGPIFEGLINNTPKGSKESLSMLNELMAGVPKKSNNMDGKKGNIALQKSNSDTVLYRKNFTKKGNNIINSSASLKKTDSGQYAIILNKESKKNFIKNLMNSLSSGVQGHTPVWTGAQSGEVTISMGSKQGSLKISPSGNLYALVSESTVNNIIADKDDEYTAASKVLKYIIGKEIEINGNSSSKIMKNTSSHIIQKNKNPQDKCIATNCRAECKSNPNSDCNSGRCACKKNESVNLSKPSLLTMDEKTETVNCNKNSKIYFCTHMSCQPYSSKGKKKQKCSNFGASTDLPNMMMTPYSMDTLGNLPPQLPPFLSNNIV